MEGGIGIRIDGKMTGLIGETVTATIERTIAKEVRTGARIVEDEMILRKTPKLKEAPSFKMILHRKMCEYFFLFD